VETRVFHDIPEPMRARMAHLEAIDARDRVDGTPLSHRLRQVTRDTGHFLALMAASTPAGRWVEVGTSAGYSALWIALAARAVGRRLETFEVLPNKIALARQTVRAAQVEDVVDVVLADAREWLRERRDVAFCFLDAEKDTYLACYDAVVPNLVTGGLLLADNVISHRDALASLVDRAAGDRRVDAVVVPVGKGVLLCRKA
jgi:caffeoyl-CoA O-methyltransferase